MTISAAPLAAAVEARMAAWAADRVTERIWDHDPTVWADPDTPEITNRLGWLHLPEQMAPKTAGWSAFAAEIADEFDRVVLCGMGGSSLAPEVFQDVFGSADGAPSLSIADSTHPDAVSALTADLDPARTLFIVSSKSGGTLETLSLYRHFWAWVGESGLPQGARFVAITDPGSGLEALAAERGFRATFHAPPDVGGRFSALCDFGLLPASLVGVDVEGLLGAAEAMASRPEAAMRLGAWMGEGALAGRDKVTIITTPSLAALPAWMEQLIAESTGKEGVGVVPVAGEPVAGPDAYGDDRLFLVYHLVDEDLPEGVTALAAAGHPVLSFALPGLAALGAEMFRAELATAAAGAVLGINPFDQPDVEAAKIQARALMSDGVDDGEDLAVFDDSAIDEVVTAVGNGDYVSLQAYAPMTDDQQASLEAIAGDIRDRTAGAAVTIGFGPRFLHSTGQLHKGGADNCVVLQLVAAPGAEGPVPESDLTFGQSVLAQAAGDAAVLAERGRTVVRRAIR